MIAKINGKQVVDLTVRQLVNELNRMIIVGECEDSSLVVADIFGAYYGLRVDVGTATGHVIIG